MAETKVIEIRTLEAIQNVKELKENIKALKEKIDDAETSTEDYAELTKELSRNQAALRNVMNGTNSTFEESIKSAQGLGYTYNALVQRYKEARQEVRAIPAYLSEADRAQGKLNQAWVEANQRANSLNDELKRLDAEGGIYTRNVGNYKSALEGFAGAMGQVKQVGGDMVNGLSAAASSLAILGINTEGLDDSMKNLRVVLAAVQGAKGFAGLVTQLKNYFKAGKNATKVTQQQTEATKAQTIAQNQANISTNQGTVALTGLQKALIATGIGALAVALGALVAHFEDIVKWVGKVGEKFGLWKLETDSVKDANEKLNEKLDEQMHTLENQQKVLAAQGTSNKTLLIQKQQLINAQINDTKVTIENVKARIKQIEADARWWKFWQGTKGKLKEANAELEELEKTLKTLQQSAEDIKVDIQVEGIKEGQKAADAAKKAAEEAAKKSAELLKKAQETVNAGAKVATGAIQRQETELEKLTREYNENVKAVKAAIEAAEKYSGVTANVEELKKGLAELEQEYYKNNFESKAAEYAKSQLRTLEQQYEAQKEYEKIYGDVLNLDSFRAQQLGRISAAEEQNLELLNAEQKWLRKNIELSDDMLANLANVNPEEITKEFGEPLATAIKLYFQKSREIKDAGVEATKTMLTGFEESFNNLLSEGSYKGADEAVSKMLFAYGMRFRELIGDSEEWDLIAEYVRNTIDEAMGKAMLDDQWFMGFTKGGLKSFVSIIDMIVSPADIAKLEERIEELKAIQGRSFEQDQEIETLEEQLRKKKLTRWNAYYTQLGKYIENYGKSTAGLLDNVADAWEAALQAQVKNGKKSEEEAKRSFENVKTLQYASAIIGTAGAVVQALADPTVPSYYVKAINAAAALAAGTAQVLKISMTEFSSNASSNTVSAPAPVDRTPQLNYTIGLNTQEYAQAAAQTPIRAYVVDKDLADGLDEYNRKENETTF